MSPDVVSIAEQLNTVRTAAAKQGYGLCRRRRPLCGWDLHIGPNTVTFGSLEHLERYLRPHRNDRDTLQRVDAAIRVWAGVN